MSDSENSKAQLVIVTGMLVLYFLFVTDVFLWIATLVGILSLVSSRLGALLVKAWYRLAAVLGLINGKVLLSIVYIFILVPVAFMARYGRRNPLSLSRNQQSSLFIVRNHRYTAKDLERAW
ncbi:SxtJ family membrane protein [Dyadobacter tibetensis]|uniref:SxtJ family membrane protein n=1 Tax=Dyadobacter tibetensis TaxID=1211851 RepID=UPI0004724395|nr:SxtJ family membrane protein [Dyadobacter tibetensis]